MYVCCNTTQIVQVEAHVNTLLKKPAQTTIVGYEHDQHNACGYPSICCVYETLLVDELHVQVGQHSHAGSPTTSAPNQK